jgi:hypothetical protein
MNRNKPIEGNESTPFSNYSFSAIVSGPPGSGKSNYVISQMTSTNGYFYRKFNKIYIFSPSLHTVKTDIALPEENFFEELDWNKVQNIFDENKALLKAGEEKQVLIVFDDLIGEISKAGNLATFNKLVLNRAHAFVSIILTTQAYNKIPLAIRKNFSNIVQFKANNRELDVIRDELTSLNRDEWNNLTKYVYSEPHTSLTIRDDNRYFKNQNELKLEF